MNSPAVAKSPLAPTLPAIRLDWLSRLAILALAAVMFAAVLWPHHGNRPSAPGGEVLASTGAKVALEEQLAPVTLVHFWATWCPPCVDEIPAIGKLSRDLAGEPKFAVVMVAVADTKPKVETFLGGPQVAKPVLYDDEWEVAHRYGTRQLPETYLVVKGRIAQKFVGATDWNDPVVRQILKKAITEES